MLGSALVPTLASAGHLVFPTDLRGASRDASGDGACGHLDYLDVRASDQIDAWVARVQPDFVVHLAAETDVDRCEVEEGHALATNAEGTRHVALACRASGIPMAYVSTAGVFDGRKETPYTEDDAAHPINAYGRSKLEGEQLVQELLDRFFIVRAGWMVGGGERDHKFVAKILQQLNGGAKRLYAVGDKWGTPTYARDFSRCFTTLIGTSSYGLYHMACLGQGTRYDVARKMLRVLGRDDVELVEVASDHFRDAFPAPRPRSEMMLNCRLEEQGLNAMRPWEESLEEYLLSDFELLDGVVRPVGASAHHRTGARRTTDWP
jgi:dTDP-4-dehydrorhamnose reductase